MAVQTHVATTLRSAVEHDRVAQAYLFCGPRGTGKTTLARVLAMSLNCENRRPDREPCGTCPSCERTWAGATSLDVIEIDAASNRTVEDARELRERAMYVPTGDNRYKVYILDEAHMLTKEAWNTLLKIIEEPPPRVVFVFATTDPQRIIAPVLSRVQRFDLRRVGPADVRERLEAVLAAEDITAEPAALAMIARAADGSMRDALSLTDQVLSLGGGALTEELVRETLGLVHDDEILGLLSIIAERRAADVFPFVARLADAGVDFIELFAGLLGAIRGELAAALGADVVDLSDRLRDGIVAAKGRFSAGDLLRMVNMAMELDPHFRRSSQQQLLFETLLVRYALLDRTVEIEAVLRGLGGAPGGGGVVAERPRAPERAARRPAADAPTVADAAPIGTPGRAAPQGENAVRPAPTLADAVEPTVGPQPLDINRLAAGWDDVVEAVRASGRAVVASALAESTPTAVHEGAVTVTASSDALRSAIEAGSDRVLKALRARFSGVARLIVSVASRDAAVPVRRMTEGDVMASRVATLRKGAPLLDAALDTLDLRLVE